MLTNVKKPAFREVQRTHVDLFVEHYDVLKRWALQFTERDHELAEDLLHDAFIQFTLNKPDLDQIQNLEGYLYIVMRNLHLSQLRKASRTPFRAVAVVDFDTVDMSFWASDPRDRIRLRDELAAVCQYACIRKESSKAGSVLILRFFHGYYPEEIGKILLSNPLAATKRLLKARAEAKVYLETPERLAFLDTKIPNIQKINIDHFGGDLRVELRKQIFSSRQGECMSQENLEDLYSGENVEHKTVAHIVSCQPCLDSVNALLELPPLSSRYPLDTLGNDPGKKGGSGGGGSEGGPGGSGMLETLITRREAHYHHEPQELCIAINGQLHSSQKVVSGKGEQTLMVDIDESLGFVEVFSEIGLRLLMLNVEPPPEGDGKQAAHVALSRGRTLDADLSFDGRVPTLQISYNDPLLSEEPAMELSVPPAVAGGLTQPSDDSIPFGNTLTESNSILDRLRGWFQPMQIAVVATVIVAALAGFWFINQPKTLEPITVRAVLKQARDTEFALQPTADNVLHRNYQVEVWVKGELNSRRRIDEWQKQKASARRTYDEQGRMIAGRWIGDDGKQQIFEQGEKLRTERRTTAPSPEAGATPPLEGGELFSPTANAFANLLDSHGVTNRTTVEESNNAYTFNFEDRMGETAQAGLNERLIAATLTLDKNSYMPVSQTLVLQIGGEQREYRFSDVRVEQKPIADVPPAIFFPEPELSKGATVVTKPLEIELPTADLANKATTTTNPTGATLDTEVEVFRALDSVNALSGDQVTIERNAAGQVRVTGIVDAAQRKTEILNALSGLRNAPGLTINVQTAAEAASAKKQNTGTITPIDVDANASTSTNLPVEDELKAHFERRGITGEKLNEQITTYANAVLNRSDSLRRNALSLKRLAERFSPAELDSLPPARRDQWKALLRSKAAAVAGDARSLSSQLSAAGLGSAGGNPGGGGAVIRDASGVAEAAQRLFGLGVECDAQVRQSFSISRGGSGSASVKTVQFWRNLNQIAAIAEGIQKY